MTELNLTELKGILLHCWECKVVLPLWRTVERFLKKLKIGSSTSLEQTQMWSFLWLSDIPLMMQGAQIWCSVTTEGWNGPPKGVGGWREVQEGGDIGMPMNESCRCMAETNTILESNYPPIKKKKNLKIDLPYDPAISLLGIYPEKNMVKEDTCTQSSLQHYLQQPRHGSNLNVH